MIEVQPEKVEGQEDPDVGNRDHEDDRQRLFQGVEQDACREENDDNDQSQQQILTVVALSPAPIAALHLDGIARRHQSIEYFDLPLLDLVSLRSRPHIFILQA